MRFFVQTAFLFPCCNWNQFVNFFRAVDINRSLFLKKVWLTSVNCFKVVDCFWAFLNCNLKIRASYRIIFSMWLYIEYIIQKVVQNLQFKRRIVLKWLEIVKPSETQQGNHLVLSAIPSFCILSAVSCCVSAASWHYKTLLSVVIRDKKLL